MIRNLLLLGWTLAIGCANEQELRRSANPAQRPPESAESGKSPAAKTLPPGGNAAVSHPRKPGPTMPATGIESVPAAAQVLRTSATGTGNETDSVVPAQGAVPTTARQVVERATAFYAAHPHYTCRAIRQERVGGKLMPRETMQMNFRLVPRSVHYTWLDEANEGRECLYSEGSNENKIVTKGGKGDLLLNGKIIRVDPNGILVKGRARYPITESGIDTLVRQLETAVTAVERGDARWGTAVCRGMAKRPELDDASVEVLQDLPPGVDPRFPEGAQRQWYFDPNDGQLQLEVALDRQGNLLEYYRFDRFIPNPLLTERDFNPVHLWPTYQPGPDS